MTSRPATQGQQPPRLADALAPYRARIEAGLAARVTDDPRARRVSPEVFPPIRHVLEAGGKRLRPLLAMLCAQACCGDAERALPTAVGLELLHTFSLVHDDVMDNDLTRRGRPTVHALWGPGIAIVAGDGLFSLAFEAIADNVHVPGVDAATVVTVTRRAAQVSFELCAGQTQDLLFEGTEDVDLDAYTDMIRQKTGVLIALSVEAGARLGGAGPEDVDALARFGLQLGLAFQVKDDLLDLIGDEAEIGKPVGSDIRAGKKTYPVIHALAHLDGSDRERLLGILRAPESETDPAMVTQALRLIETAGSLAAAQAHAERLITDGKAQLARLRNVHDHAALETLVAIADYIVQRRT